MPSLAEVKHEYVKDEIERLTASNAVAQATIDENTARMKYLEGETARVVEKLVAEHPWTPEVVTVVPETPKPKGKKERS